MAYTTSRPASFYTDSELEQIDEKELVDRFQNGDTEAFNPLVLKYQNKIYNLMYRQVRDQETAKDLCQEVFLKAFKALPHFKGDSAFYSWIYRIALNCGIDFQRQCQRGKFRPFEELPSEADDVLELIDSDPPPERFLERKELVRIIWRAVRELPPRQRRVFTLRYQRELAIKEIAVLLNRSEGTIKAHLHHAHRQLRGMLRPYLENEPLEWNT